MLIRKRLTALFTAAVLLVAMGVTAVAYEAPDLSKKGSISVTMKANNKVIPGGKLTLYRVGDAKEDNGNLSFQLTEDFKGSKASLKDVTSASLAKTLAEYASKQKLTGKTVEIDKNGTVKFDDLRVGVYLLVQNTAASGYNKVNPFLVTIPMTQKDKYVYDVDASPKMETIKPTTNTPSTSTSTRTSTLPKTGQLNWPIPIMVIAGLCLFSIGWVLRFGGRGKYEK